MDLDLTLDGKQSARRVVGAEVLVVDHDASVQAGIKKVLETADLHVTAVSEPMDVGKLLAERFFAVCLVDLDTPHPNVGLDTLTRIMEAAPTSKVVMMTPRKSFDDAVACLRAGAVDVIHKTPTSAAHLVERVSEAAVKAVQERQLSSVLELVRETHEGFLKRFMASERRALDFEDQLLGRDPDASSAEAVRVLVVCSNANVAQAFGQMLPQGFAFVPATSGGQALDMGSSAGYQVALVAAELHDLPSSMVTTGLLAQSRELQVLRFDMPGLGARVEQVTDDGISPVITDFKDLRQLGGLLQEMTKSFRVRDRERRYVNDFKQRHYDFLRKFVELKAKLEAL